MTRIQHKVTLEERKSPHALEKAPRYAVMLNGEKTGELYHNMTGYRGAIPTHDGAMFDIGEAGIGQWRKIAAQVNRWAKAAIEAGQSDPRQVTGSLPTDDNDVVAVVSVATGEISQIDFVRRKAFHAAQDMFGGERVGLGFFDLDDHDAKNPPTILLTEDDAWIEASHPKHSYRFMSEQEARLREHVIDRVFPTDDTDTVLLIGREGGDGRAMPVFASRASAELAQARYGDRAQLADVQRAEANSVSDPAVRGEIASLLPGFDMELLPRAEEQEAPSPM